MLDTDKGQYIKRDDNCFLMFAMNPAWDIRNDGTNTLADADIRRLYHIEMGLPEPEVERDIIISHCKLDGFDIPEKLLDLVMQISTGIRSQSDDALPVTWGIASNIKVARYLNWFDPITAYKTAVADSLEPDIRDIILNEVRTRFGVNKLTRRPTATKHTEKERDTAWKAVQKFRAMLPQLESFLYSATGKNIKIVLRSTPGSSTNGENVYLCPPYELGFDLPHNVNQCDRVDSLGYQRCKACAVREEITVNIYHEASHIVFGTFAGNPRLVKWDTLRRYGIKKPAFFHTNSLYQETPKSTSTSPSC